MTLINTQFVENEISLFFDLEPNKTLNQFLHAQMVISEEGEQYRRA